MTYKWTIVADIEAVAAGRGAGEGSARGGREGRAGRRGGEREKREKEEGREETLG